jgi:aromatic ring-opening dioxygenase catalytic subunit (LigB family)
MMMGLSLLYRQGKEGFIMFSTASLVPVVAVSAPPRGTDDISKFASGIRTLADTLNAAGVVVVEPHWNRAGDDPVIVIDVDHSTAEVQTAFVLAERISDRLIAAGMKPQHGGAWPRDTRVWKAIVDACGRASYPLLHVAVPARYGTSLMTMVAVALRPLRGERILFVSFSDAFGDAMLAADADDFYSDHTEGAPI